MIFESNGKILLTSEYLVLDGAISLALPSKLTQELFVEKIDADYLHWVSYDNNKSIWYEERFFKNGKSIIYKGEKNNISDRIISLFNHIHSYTDIDKSFGKKFISKINFNRDWGLGSSSTLVNNLAKWANINAYDLLFSSFEGSGYDIACCDKSSPIIYSNNNNTINVSEAKFNPHFKKNLFLVYLGKKQNTQESIFSYNKIKFDKVSAVKKINKLTKEIIICNDLSEFEKLIESHENMISKIINIDPIQKSTFSDYNKGVIKSLGSWGGDFILVSGEKEDLNYFRDKGYNTIYDLEDLVYLN